MVKAESIPSWDLFSRVQKLEDSMFAKSDAKEMEKRLDRKMAEMEERSDRKMAEMENHMLFMVSFLSLIGIVSRYIGRTRP